MYDAVGKTAHLLRKPGRSRQMRTTRIALASSIRDWASPGVCAPPDWGTFPLEPRGRARQTWRADEESMSGLPLQVHDFVKVPSATACGGEMTTTHDTATMTSPHTTVPACRPTGLDPFLVRRFRWNVDALSQRFDDAALVFFDRLKRECPTAKCLVPPWNRQSRFTMAARYAEIIKHIENPAVQVAPLRRAFMALGLTHRDLEVIQGALLHACKEAAGTMWTEQMEADWAAALDWVFNLMRTDQPRSF